MPRQGTIIAVKRSLVSEKIVAYRLKGTAKYGYRTIDVPGDKIKAVLGVDPTAIDNLKLVNDELEFVNGSSKRYTDLNQVGCGYTTLVILNKIKISDDESIYEMADYKGNVLVADESTALTYATRNGLANGKVVTKGDKRVISAIEGEYPTRCLTDSEKIRYDVGKKQVSKQETTQSKFPVQAPVTPAEVVSVQLKQDIHKETEKARESDRNNTLKNVCIKQRENKDYARLIMPKIAKVKGKTIESEIIPTEYLKPYFDGALMYLKSRGLESLERRIALELVRNEFKRYKALRISEDITIDIIPYGYLCTDKDSGKTSVKVRQLIIVQSETYTPGPISMVTSIPINIGRVEELKKLKEPAYSSKLFKEGAAAASILDFMDKLTEDGITIGKNSLFDTMKGYSTMLTDLATMKEK